MSRLLFLVFMLGAPALAQAHTHGVAQLDASLEGDEFQVALELPLDTLLGFERAPREAQDFARLAEVLPYLRAGDRLLLPSPAAACSLRGVSLASAVIAPGLLGETAPAVPAQAPEQAHADLEARYSFRCARPVELKRLEVAFFDAFKRLRVIEARVVTSRLQRAAKLTPQSRSLAW